MNKGYKIINSDMEKSIVEQVEQTKIDPFSREALMIEAPLVISMIIYVLKELVKFLVKKKTAKYAAEIQRQKLDQIEKFERIKYLEKQNEMLLSEILDLRSKMEISRPLNLDG